LERLEHSDTLNTEKSDIVADICAGGSKRNTALRLLYKNEKVKGSIAQYVLNYGGDDEDVRHVFQEAVIVFDRKIREGRFRKDSQWDTFIIGIGRNICRNHMRTKKKWNSLDDKESSKEDLQSAVYADTHYYFKELSGVLSETLEGLKPLCREVLMLWTQDYSMSQIAEMLDLGRPANARKRKFRCMKELMNVIQSRPDLGDYLKEAWKTIK
jgi:RNA polymerase sigma factor (sigma-70 family)